MRQRLKIALVVALVALNAGLLYLVAEKMSDSRAATRDPAVEPSPTLTSPTPSQNATPAPDRGGRPDLVVADDDTIFRIYGGSCDGKAAPGITASTDTGATFQDVDLPADVRSILALTATSADDLDLVVADAECGPVRYVSSDGGGGWEAAESADVWFRQPGSKVVISPTGETDTECIENRTLSAINDQIARVFCASGILVGTEDSARTWDRLGSLDGVKAAAFTTRNRGFALAPDGGCATGSYTTVDAGLTWKPTACLDAAPGRALAANRDLVAAIVGNDVYVSEDAGRSWRSR